MPPSDSQRSGVQGFGLVAVTYVYFLIFAQFAFLHRLTDLGFADEELKAALGTMAVAGILFSLLVPRSSVFAAPDVRLRIGFIGCGAAAFLTLLPLGLAGSIAVSFLIGGALGLVTVTLATHMRRWTGANPLFAVAIGTGFAYFLCNIPPLFEAAPEIQTATAGLVSLAGVCITLLPTPRLRPQIATNTLSGVSFAQVLACFTALVWLDSAAYFIIQNAPQLKAATWQGSIHLWANGGVHFAAALASAWLLRRRSTLFVLLAAFAALGSACLLLMNPALGVAASVLYPAGVSLYSVALVAYPSLLAPASSLAQRGRQAGWIYAVAGWAGSAMGIGMAQDLGRVPPAFVIASAALLLAPVLLRALRTRMREFALTAAALLAAFLIERMLTPVQGSTSLTSIERGRQVYISEGCINCHSQYVRPNSRDELLWGPAENLSDLRLQRPPLIGNRRQGPDLSQVGNRRSPLWLKAHFYNPQQVSGASIMPSYGFLFRDNRGNDLLAYLGSLRRRDAEAEHRELQDSWRPAESATREADAKTGERLFNQDCTTCHTTDGQTRLAWQSSFKRMPPDLTFGPFPHLSVADNAAQRMTRLEQIIKFGIQGTDMPGHEYLSDEDVASISLWVSQLTAHPTETPSHP